MIEKIYVTKEWLSKLQEELFYLKNTKRLEIADKLREAISFWDLSENSEYEEARNEQAQVEKRIIDIEEQLKNIELVDETYNKNESKAKIWSIVTISESWKKEELVYKIVGTTEADILNSDLVKISNESPLWKAIIWKNKKDKISFKAPGWIFEYYIIDIK